MDPLEPRGHTISPISAHILKVETVAQKVFVVEKETVFHRLIDGGFLEKHKPCVLVTARGFPDVPTRYFLRQLSESCGSPCFYLLVDFDPSGLVIAATYGFGPEGGCWMQDDLRLRSSLPLICAGGVEGASNFGLNRRDVLPLTARDRAVGRGLQRRLEQIKGKDKDTDEIVEKYEEGLKHLLEVGLKYELDALDKLPEFIAHMVSSRAQERWKLFELSWSVEFVDRWKEIIMGECAKRGGSAVRLVCMMHIEGHQSKRCRCKLLWSKGARGLKCDLCKTSTIKIGYLSPNFFLWQFFLQTLETFLGTAELGGAGANVRLRDHRWCWGSRSLQWTKQTFAHCYNSIPWVCKRNECHEHKEIHRGSSCWRSDVHDEHGIDSWESPTQPQVVLWAKDPLVWYDASGERQGALGRDGGLRWLPQKSST